MQTWTFAFLSSAQPAATAAGCPSPFEPLMKGLRPERPQGAQRANPTFVLPVGEARRRGGGTMYASTTPTPEYAMLEGCAALGGQITIISHGVYL